MMYYSASMNTLDESLMNAVKEGKLLESSRTNIRLLLDGTKSPIAHEAVEELAAAGEWQVGNRGLCYRAILEKYYLYI